MTTPPIAPLRRPSGFTMIELIMTMVIIGVMAVVALPRLDMLRGFDEAGYRDKVKATLEYARKSAVAQRRHVRITTAGNGMTVEISSLDPDAIAAWPIAFARALELPGSASNAVTPPSGGTLVASVSPLAFDPLGRPLNATTGVALAGAATFTVSGTVVTVEAETGHVH
jgi:MSHA pilin protein MshC